MNSPSISVSSKVAATRSLELLEARQFRDDLRTLLRAERTAAPHRSPQVRSRRLELEHIHPWARWGDDEEANLRLVCRAHASSAERQSFGARCTERYGAAGRPSARRP